MFCADVVGGITLTSLNGLFGIYELPIVLREVLTIVIIVFVINAFNLIDGIDGLCSGLSLLAIGFFGLWFWQQGLSFYATIAFAQAGVVSVFFFFNTMGQRLKIFMGDTGSLLLGFVISFLALKFCQFNIIDPERGVSFLGVIMGVLFIPLFDTFRVFFSRMMLGNSPFHADKNHIHHKILKLGMTHLQSTLTILLIQSFFILLNTLLRYININALFMINLILGVLLIHALNLMAQRRARKSAGEQTPQS